MGLKRVFRRSFRLPEPPTLDEAEDGAAVKKAILAYLRTHRRWYACWSRFYSLTWNIGTLLILVLGALTSILTAIKPPIVSDLWLIALPALSSLTAGLLIQFRLKDSCRVRENGRIATEVLICKALLIETMDLQKAKHAAVSLREAAHQLEREQLGDFLADVNATAKSPVVG